MKPGDLSGVRTAREAPEEVLARLPPPELVEHLVALRGIMDAALAQLKLEPLLEQLVDRICAALRAEVVTVLLSAERGEVLETRASRGLEEGAARRSRVPLGEGVAGTVASTREAVIVDDPAAVGEPGAAPGRLRAMMAVPLEAEGALLGVLLVGSRAPRRFTRAELALLQVVGDRVALALRRARLYHEALLEGRQRAAAEGAAAEAMRVKNDFLAVMSHELRTPLAAVMGYAELLRLGIPVEIPPGAVTQVERIEHAAKHLLRLIEEVLSFSRAESGREEVRRTGGDLRRAVSEAAAAVQPMAARKGLAVRVQLPADPVAALTDVEKVREIVWHLLSNAVKFTRAGEVSVGMEEGPSVEIRVSDTGVGIAPSDRDRVFELFWQVDQGSTREAEGMGLGLALARRLTALLGGELRLDTELGRGTTVTLRLPKG